MPIIITDFEQGSPEWDKARAGNVGASNIDKIITSTGAVSKQREDFMMQLAGERIIGMPEPTGYNNQHMENGKEREDECRALFSMAYNVEVKKIGIVFKDKYRLCHASPDGLIGDNAGLEMKNPMIKTHVRYLLEGKVPVSYFSQIQFSLYVTEREKWFFMSSFTGMNPLIIECGRDEKWIKMMEAELNKFNEEMLKMVQKLS